MLVVMNTIRPAHIPANTESTEIKSKIPDYAKDFRNEYLFIRGIDKQFKYFLDNINDATRGIFQNHRVEIIKKHIKKFELAQRLGYLNDISNLEILEKDVYYTSKIKKDFNNFKQYIKFVKDCYDDDQPFIDPYPGFKNIYDAYELFCSKFKIKFEEGSYSCSFWDFDSDSDSDEEVSYSCSFWDFDSDSDSD